MPQTIQFAIKGMTCDHCVRAITNAVEEIEGVTAAEVSLDTNSARVEGEIIDVAKIIAAIEEEGYEATLVG